MIVHVNFRFFIISHFKDFAATSFVRQTEGQGSNLSRQSWEKRKKTKKLNFVGDAKL